MAALSDIEESSSEGRVKEVNTTVGTPSTQSWNVGDTASVTSSRGSTKASKSASVALAIDSSVLAMISTRDEDSEDENERQSTLCCLSCCDLVRAVWITDVVAIFIICVLATVSLFDAPVEMKLDLYEVPTADDDYGDLLYAQDRSITLAGYFRLARIGLASIFASIGIIGAKMFQKHLLLCASAGYVIFGIWSAFDGKFVSPAVSAFFLYPHIALFLALQKGKITRENYTVTEEYCCCCGNETDDY